jgi:hypothetical protein
MAQLVTDYVNLTSVLIKLAKDKDVSQSDFNNILNLRDTQSTKRSDEARRYRDL